MNENPSIPREPDTAQQPTGEAHVLLIKSSSARTAPDASGVTDESTAPAAPEPDTAQQPLGGAYVPQIRPAMEDVCCGSGCSGCPTYWGD